MVPTHPTIQNKVQSSLQSIHGCDPEAGTYTILTSWTNSDTVPASCSTYRAACHNLGAQMGPLKRKKLTVYKAVVLIRHTCLKCIAVLLIRHV